MSYAVIWTARTLDDLADVWVNTPAEGRDAVEAAVAEINRQLGENAAVAGESRSHGGIRITFAGPLVVLFEADPVAQIARVGYVCPRRRS